LTISSATLGNITTLEFLNIADCRSVTELPPQVVHQRSLKELQLSGANLKELPSEIGNLCNLEVLSIGNELFEVLPPFLSCLKSLKRLILGQSPRLKYLPDHFSSLIQLEELVIQKCGIEYLPQDLPKMNNLRDLTVCECPLLELPFKKIEEERETGRELNKLESVHDNDKSMFGLTNLRLLGTEISEVFFAESVCPNLRFLQLQCCNKLTKIGGLCGLSKLQHLDIIVCERIEELPNIEMLISLEVFSARGCVKLKSIPGLGQLRKLRYLNVSRCHEIVELSGAKHLMLLKHLDARDCPKLRWDEGVLEEVRQRLKEGLKV
jgi:leucine-rich repeat protein SHOC2